MRHVETRQTLTDGSSECPTGGINAWASNSHVVHAVSDKPGGAYRRTAHAEVFPIFSHEPNFARAPSGDFVVYFTAHDPRNHSVRPGCACTNGTSSLACGNQPFLGRTPTFMSYTKPSADGGRPEGPWSEPVELFAAQRDEINMDTNFAAVILQNGSVVGLGRTGGKQGIVIHLVTATHWRDAASYTGRWKEPLFDLKSVPDAGLEDPFVYMGRGGVFHAVFHNQIQQDDERLAGGHAWSEDGIEWVFSGTSWNNTVAFVDGGSFTFSRMERPHLIFGNPSAPYDPTHLTTGVQFGSGELGSDACMTLLQPTAAALALKTDEPEDDTALLDRLALEGGLIELEPRTYHRRGPWRIAKNHTVVRGVPGLTSIVMDPHVLINGTACPGNCPGIYASTCPLNDTTGACTYANRYSCELRHLPAVSAWPHS